MPKKVKAEEEIEPEDAPEPEVSAAAAALPDGPAVLYMLNEGVNPGAQRPAVLVDVGGADPRIFVQTEDGDGLPQPLVLSLTQYIGGVTAPYFHADQLPGTWHWPAA